MKQPKISPKDLRCPECFADIGYSENEDGKIRVSCCTNGHKYPTYFVEQEARRRLSAIIHAKITE